MRVEQWRDVFRVRFPVHGQLRLPDEFADAGTDHVYTDHRAVVDAHNLDGTAGANDGALAVAAQVVVIAADGVVAVLLLRCTLAQSDRGNLWV